MSNSNSLCIFFMYNACCKCLVNMKKIIKLQLANYCIWQRCHNFTKGNAPIGWLRHEEAVYYGWPDVRRQWIMNQPIISGDAPTNSRSIPQPISMSHICFVTSFGIISIVISLLFRKNWYGEKPTHSINEFISNAIF